MAAQSSNDPAGFVGQHGYNWWFGVDSTNEALKQYGVRGIPHTLFIDRSGKIVDQKIGGMEKAEFEERVRKIL